MADTILYIGTYTRPESFVQGQAEGIYAYRMDTDGGLHRLSSVGGVTNPSFVTLDKEKRHLYAVQETEVFDGHTGGGVSAFSIDPGTHALTLINSQPTHGAHPCHLSIDPTGRFVLVANYTGANVTVLPIGEDGSVGPASAVVPHEGVPSHHNAPHPHSIVSDGELVLAPDCGLDRIFLYRLDEGQLKPADPAAVMLVRGAGPRHTAFHPSGDYLFVINEQNSSLTGFVYKRGSGPQRMLQTYSTVPLEFTGSNSTADIHVHPNGRFVYGSNRGHNSLAIFAFDAENERLTPVGHASTGGRTPRNFAIDPTGTFLLAANQDSSTIVTFRINQETGQLTQVASAEVPTPVCIRFVDE
jgi:6-phosphogluconolactonase